MKNKNLFIGVPLVCSVSSVVINRYEAKTNFKKERIIRFDTTYQINVSDENFANDELDNIKIIGNYNSVKETLANSIRSDKESIYVLYDLNLKDNVEGKFGYDKYNALISYYVGNEYRNDFYNSNESELDLLKDDINNFVNEKVNFAVKEKEKFENSNTSSLLADEDIIPMKTLYRNSFRVENKPLGYVDIRYTANKARVNDISSLWLIETASSFTPGATAVELGKNGYELYYNARQYLKIDAEQPLNEVGYNQIRYGGIPEYKEAYPKNVPGKALIVSSYSNNSHIGFSTENGLEIGYGTAWEYSQTYENSEPRLSAQLDPDDVTKYTWLYNYIAGRNETNNVTNGYIFEQNNDGHDLLENDIAFNIEFKFWVTDVLNEPIEESRLTSFSKINYFTYV